MQSEIGKGSCFTIEIPIDIVGSNFESQYQATEITTPPDIINILAVEDNITNQFVLKTLLGHFPVNLTFANNGKEAIEIIEIKDFDLVFMDLQMPIMDGIEATRIIREKEKFNQSPTLPIFALSANALEKHREETRCNGFNGHIAKPIILETLLGAIEDAFTIRQNQISIAA